MKLTWATGTDTGRVRSNNQDSVFPPQGSDTSTNGLLIAVADGMGGHVGGEIASSTALAAALSADGTPRDRIAEANRAVLEAVRADHSLRGMGTTLTLASIASDGSCVVGHVGDSRAYRARGRDIVQLTADHTVIAEYLASGKITPAQAKRHPQRSVITRAVGIIDDLAVDQFEERFVPGDRLLICSDGLTAMVDDEQIRQLIEAYAPDEAVRRLIEAANRAGGVDNITVAVVAFES